MLLISTFGFFKEQTVYQFLPSQKRPLVGIVAAVCLGLSFNAQAGVVSELTARSEATATGSGSSSIDQQGPASPYVASSAYQYSDVPFGQNYAASNAFGETGAGGYTRYAASASGTGGFMSRAEFTKTLTVTNDQSYTQSYSLSYFIYGGSLRVGNWSGNFATGDTGEAKLSFRIFDLTDLLERSASLILGGGTTHFENRGFNSSGFSAGDTSAYTDSESGTLSLGLLAAGESRTITYELITEATGNYQFVHNNNCCYECGNGYGDGYGDIVATSFINECGYGAGGSYAFLGDPNGVDGGTINITGQRYNAVPLPGTLALMGIGLAGFGIARRKRN